MQQTEGVYTTADKFFIFFRFDTGASKKMRRNGKVLSVIGVETDKRQKAKINCSSGM